ncbi:thioesterase II family protein [Nocardia suismassiliense]|uniref:thioesterase II family protein n=1 Tax=Nocardia suismassiliense TaxID=2077092 RepID=UPI0018FE9C9F|nr:alpha/beta fold hydrolase [Nocardia suismassiliense]
MPDPDGLWFSGIAASPAAIQLVCFAHAGGAPSVFRDWPAHLGPDVQVVPVLLPGRGLRLWEPASADIGALARDIATALIEQGFLDRYAFFGHSMGALLAYEVTCVLRERGAPAPERVFVSGSRAPHLYGTALGTEMSDDALLAWVRELGGLLGSGTRTQFDRRLPTLRADLRACESYRPQRRRPLDCPLTVFSAEGDLIADLEQTEQWRSYTTGAMRRRHFPGGHFYLVGPHRFSLLRELSDDLARFTPARRRKHQ